MAVLGLWFLVFEPLLKRDASAYRKGQRPKTKDQKR